MICPICGIMHRSLGQHYFHNHPNEYKNQVQLVVNDYKLGISPKSDPNCILGEKTIHGIIHKHFSKKEREQYSSKLRSNVKKSLQKTVNYTTSQYYKNVKKWHMDWTPYQKYAKTLPYTFENFKSIQYSQKLDYCPICNESINKNGDSMFKHLHMKGIHDNEHQKLFDKELKNIIQGFFDLNLDLQNCSMFTEKAILKTWKNVFPNYRQRIELTMTKWHSKNYKKKLIYSNIDWNDLSYPPKNLTSNICPICGKDSEFGLWNHLIINDKTHNDLLYQYIAFLYQEFNNKKFNQYHYTSFLKYKEILSIWKHLNLDVNAREKEVRDYVVKHNKEYYFQNRKFNAIRGYRKDLDLVCNSSWEANIYRILKHNHSRFKTEIAKDIVIGNKHKTYFIDCLDIDGFFQKGAYLEIKGCMTDDNKKKITAFKQQYPNETLLIIGDSKQYPCDYDYYKVIEQYKVDSIYWETLNHNPRTNPDLYIK